MRHVAVIDYGMGNLRSVCKALEHVATNDVVIKVTSDSKQILSASHVILPGVGAIRDCMYGLQRLNLDHVICEVARQKPLLGICLGMQALLTKSEENGGVNNLGIISGNVCHFKIPNIINESQFKVPHMGWNRVNQTLYHPIWSGIDQNSYFYFAHSYFVVPDKTLVTAATTHYPDKFTSAIYKENIFAVQFHPEKSQNVGLQFLKNFLYWDGNLNI